MSIAFITCALRRSSFRQPSLYRFFSVVPKENLVFDCWKENLVIVDTILRDAEQSPTVSLPTQEKLRIAGQLSRMGVDVCEVGFPVTYSQHFDDVRRIAKEVGPLIEGRTSGKPMTIAGLSRAIETDIQRTYDAVKGAPSHRIHTFLVTSDIHLDRMKITREECIKQAVHAVKFAKSLTEDVEFSAKDAGRSDPDFMVKLFSEVIKAGVNTINVPDTSGCMTPEEYGALIKFLMENTKGSKYVIWSTHCHDDLGLAVANTLCGISNGARQVEVTSNDIDEGACNTSLEKIVTTLNTRPNLYDVRCNIVTPPTMLPCLDDQAADDLTEHSGYFIDWYANTTNPSYV